MHSTQLTKGKWLWALLVCCLLWHFTLATNGVVIATEKKVPTILIEESSIQKIQPLSENIGVHNRLNIIRRCSICRSGSWFPCYCKEGTKESQYIFCDVQCMFYQFFLMSRSRFPVQFLFKKSLQLCRNIHNLEAFVRSECPFLSLDTMKTSLDSIK